MVCSVIDHRNDVKMFKTQVEPRAVGAEASLQNFEHFDFISMVDKRTYHGKLLSIFFYNNIDSFDVHFL